MDNTTYAVELMRAYGQKQFKPLHTLDHTRVSRSRYKMNRPGKVENIVSEAADMQLDVCGLSETHWTQSGEMTIGEHMVITSSDQNRNYQGVGLIISKNLRKSVMSYNAVSSRNVTIRIKARPANMSIIQIYAPTLDKDDEVHDEFYEQLQVTIESIKRSDYLIVMGDFNAILGNEKVPCVTGAHGTGIRNNSGQRLLEFCSGKKNNMKHTMKN